MIRLLKRIARAFGAGAIALASPAAADQPAASGLTVENSGGHLVVEGDKAGPALWKVSDEDTTIYLFGTLHALPGGLPWLDGKLAQAIDSADELVTEVDLSSQAALQKSLLQKGALPAGQTLRSMMKPKERADFEQVLAAAGLPPQALDRMKPWSAGLMLSLLPIMKGGFSPEAGVEQVLNSRLASTKRRDALETVDFQLDLFDTLPMDAQLKYLGEVVKSAPEQLNSLNAMLAEWLKGDAEGLAELMNSGDDDPQFAERLLYSRNRNWADWIQQRLAKPGTVFMAVGAGHLAGKKSVQDVLASRGIASSRVQ